MQQALLLPCQASGPATAPGPRAGIEQERRELGYSIGADGVIEILRPGDPTREPVN